MLYEKFEKGWKIWLWIPIILLILSIGVIAVNISSTGSFMKRDIELTGGKSITFEVSAADLPSIRSKLPYANVHLTSGVTRSLIVELPFERDESEIIPVVEEHADVVGEPTFQSIGPSIGNIFFQQAQLALVAAFILMAITVLILFRSPVPSSIVVLAAVTDIIVTIAVLSLMGFALSLPVLAALLTLIGYSVDTDLLLTSELLKGHHAQISDGVKRAMKTGLTLTLTTLVALFAMYFVAGSVIIAHYRPSDRHPGNMADECWYTEAVA
jgi:preprotein translocase subunit SecF